MLYTLTSEKTYEWTVCYQAVLQQQMNCHQVMKALKQIQHNPLMNCHLCQQQSCVCIHT